MTNQTAVTILKKLEQSLDDYCKLNDECIEAFYMAITTLELFGNSEQLQNRKTGKWNQIISIPNDMYGRYYCSECGKEGNPVWYFCPCCGADMRGE